MEHILALITCQRQIDTLHLVTEGSTANKEDGIIVDLGAIEHLLVVVGKEVIVLHSLREHREVATATSGDADSIAHFGSGEPLSHSDTSSGSHRASEADHIALRIV